MKYLKEPLEKKKNRFRIRNQVVTTTQIPLKPEIVDEKITLDKLVTESNIITIDDKILLDIAKLAQKNGYEVYVVGGFVRDYFLNSQRKDFDFTVVGNALEFAELVAKKFKSKAVIFERFMTAMVPLKNGIQLEFVGTRKEEYENESRNPIVTNGTLTDDLKRRDFTVNAMAISLQKENFGEVIDLFNGRFDLNKKILKTPLDPRKTFEDDPLRMMRAARFASQLNFEIDSNTFDAIKIMNHRLKIISQERISSEFLKILASEKPSIGLNYLSESGLLSKFFPDLEDLKGVEIKIEGSRQIAHKDVFIHSLKVVDNISLMTENVWLRFAALIHDIAKPRTKRYNSNSGWTFHGHEELGAKMAERIFRKFKLPLDKMEYVEKLVRLHQRPMMLVDNEITDSAIRRLAFNAGDALDDLFTLCRADITTKNPNLSEQYLNNYDIVCRKVIDVQEKDKLREFQSPVRGEEIMEICNLQPCKAIGLIKSNIEEAILDGLIPNDYNKAKEFFLQNMDLWLSEISLSDKKHNA
jgi:putative nucleotidyltransferase with HDIG domain